MNEARIIYAPTAPTLTATPLTATTPTPTAEFVAAMKEHDAQTGAQVSLAVTHGEELYMREFPPREFLIDGLIARGNCVVLAGRPKSGKSWLAFQIAQAIDTGGYFLARPPKQRVGKVLYLALEDGERRIHERMHVRNWRPNHVAFAFGCYPFDAGEGVAQVANAAAGFDVVIIDTLIATLTAKTDESSNSAMAEIMNRISRFAHESGKAIVIVHHTGKMATEDPFDAIRGASSIRAAYDVGVVLQRQNKEAEAILRVESRDIEAPDMTIRWTGKDGWAYTGDGAQYEQAQKGKRAVKALADLGDWQGVEKIAEHMGISEQSVRAQLKNALAVGAVETKTEDPKGKKPRDLWRVK